MSHELIKLETDSDWRDYHSLRRTVLWEARGRSDYDENHPDEYLADNHPLLLRLNGRSIGTTRLDDFGDGTGAVRLVAIAPDMQRRGHGRVLSQQVDDYARQLGIRILHVNAVRDAVGYYEKMGWKADIWNEADLTDIQQMSKRIDVA